MQITNQKKMAAQLLKVGVNRIWVDPEYLDQVTTAVQKNDIRELIEEGYIKAKPIQGTSRFRARKKMLQRRAGRQKGHGTRSGSANARFPRKQRWMRTIRAQRRQLKMLRSEESINPSQYRYYYRKAKGGSYRSVAHLRQNIELDGINLGGAT
jgi:large subunit ribosomal protein L19e